jgi:hypothetical protein
MPKYYVQSGPVRAVIDAADAEEAAIKAVQWSCDQRDTIHGGATLESLHYPDDEPGEMHDDIFVSETGFDRDDAKAFDTLEIVALWQGYAFPWDEQRVPGVES